MPPITSRATRLALAVLSAARLAAQTEPADPPAAPPQTLHETIQVVATREPEPVAPVPASITVVSGEELRQRGADDLASALALVAGVSVAPGGDGGPASSVPELWGLREFDAFLLVVDGVPWGGAFNPALAALDLDGIDHIEVLRGPAPVFYGATSFVGVIDVVHHEAAGGQRSASAWGGSRSSGGGSVHLPFAGDGAWRQSLAVDFESRNWSADRTGFDRAHLLYRGLAAAAGGNIRFDFDADLLEQEPGSPHPRAGRTLTPLVPLDTNQNPADAKIDENRFHLVGGYDRSVAGGLWTTTLALTFTDRDLTRGFLRGLDDDVPADAAGFSQEQEQRDLYFDTRFARRLSDRLNLIAGVDYLWGEGESEGENFDYHVNLDGSGAQSSADVPVLEETGVEDQRGFGGVYAHVEWTPLPRLRVDAGGRFNFTDEEREGEVETPEGEVVASSSRSVTRGSGAIGASWQLLGEPGAADGLWLFADGRDAFKPAAIDFGPEAESVDILEPETAQSLEGGVKGRHLDGRIDWQASVFRMDFDDLVTSVVRDGRPVLINSGEQRFEGWEVEGGWRILDDLRARATYAHHSSKFVDFVQIFDGVPTQLAGKRLEMAPEELGSLGLSWLPARGLDAWAVWSYVGERFLNKRNTALAAAYDTWEAGVGWRAGAWRVAVHGENLSDARDPVAESELGDAQYYRLPARSYELRVTFDF